MFKNIDKITFLTSFFNILIPFRHKIGFGLPPTPPSSLSSDDSEGNQSPEHHTMLSSSSESKSPMLTSDSNSQQSIKAHQMVNGNQSIRRTTLAVQSGSPNSCTTPTSSRGYTGSSSRQPIHTPLISNQPVCHLFFTSSIF